MSLKATMLEQQALEKMKEGEHTAAYECLMEAVSEDDTDNIELLEKTMFVARDYIKDYEAVVRYADLILAIDDASFTAIIQKAWALFDLNNIEESYETFLKGLEHAATPEDILYTRSGRGLCNYRLNRYEEAVSDLEDSIAVYDKWVVGFANLGWAYTRLGRFKEAAEVFSTAIELSEEPYGFAHAGRGEAYYELYEYDLAIADLTIGLEDNPQWIKGFALRGWCYLDIRFHENQYELALADLNKAIELSEADADFSQEKYSYAYAGRGLAHYELDHYEEAANDLTIAKADNQKWARGFAVLGWSLLELGRKEEALENFETALKISEDDYPYAYGGRGLTYYEMNNYQKAIEDLEKALEGNSKWVRGRAVLAWSLYEVNADKKAVEKAEKILDDLLAETTDYPYAYAGRALVKYDLRKYEQAISDFDISLKTYDKWSKGFAVRGWSKYQAAQNATDYDAAIEDFQYVIDLDNGFLPYVNLGLGYSYYMKKQYKDAKKHLELAQQEYLLNSDFLTTLAKVYHLIDKKKSGKKLFELAIENCKTTDQRIRIYHSYALFLEDCGEYKQALANYNKALANGDRSWIYASIAEFYKRGWGTKQDFNKAFEYFNYAFIIMQKQNEYPQFYATQIDVYFQGIGVASDHEKAKELMLEATKQKNDDPALLHLIIYFNMTGTIVPQNDSVAYDFIQLLLKNSKENALGWYYMYLWHLHQGNQVEAQDARKKAEEYIEKLDSIDPLKRKAVLQRALQEPNPPIIYPRELLAEL
jgi:Tfp pilus assembly protein PilF